jgi:hypothetical protein
MVRLPMSSYDACRLPNTREIRELQNGTLLQRKKTSLFLCLLYTFYVIFSTCLLVFITEQGYYVVYYNVLCV